MFSKRLSELRKKKGFSQYKLADELGFSRGQVANYEQGTREPDYQTLLKIAEFFNVSTDYLLGRDD
ncbi:XRE family transcriptional regulator, partial [Listeria monocytogenes]|nr:XRE family transcriptional regulator [Listeria monocytogenes]